MKTRAMVLALTLTTALLCGVRLHAEPVSGTAGPYAVEMEYDAVAHPEHTVYRPANLAALKGRMPFIAFGNGGCLNIGNLEKKFLAEVASYGYVVTAPGKIEVMPENFGPANTGGITVTQAKPGQMRRAIDWATAQAITGPWKGHVDPRRIAVMGASCGGLDAIATGGDARVKAVVIFNSGIIRGSIPGAPGAAVGAAPRPAMQLPGTEADLARLHTPVIYLIGGPKDIAYQASEKDFTQIQRVPIFNANMDVGHAGTMGQAHGGAMGAAAIAWLNWQLKGDSKAARNFKGPDCGLCRDPAWQVKKKNLR